MIFVVYIEEVDVSKASERIRETGRNRMYPI